MQNQPDNIGKYQVTGLLGEGGFGRVYKAFDPTVGRAVAIKVLNTSEPGVLARFQNEATTAGNLHHENIVTIYEFGVQAGAPFIVMEYLEGEDLQQIIDAQRPMSLLDKVRIMAQVGSALQCIHEKNFVHRDVKPANIMVLRSGQVKLMDFGLARMTDDATSRVTQKGFLIGTILYMSPEQLAGTDMDAVAEEFVYGTIFYQLMVGKHPFLSDNFAASIHQILAAEPAPLSQAAPECPEELEQIVMRSLQKDRNLRYSSMEDLLFDLQPVMVDLQKERAATLLARAAKLVDRGDFEAATAMTRDVLELDAYYPEARELRTRIQQLIQQKSTRPDSASEPVEPPKDVGMSDRLRSQPGEFTKMFSTSTASSPPRGQPGEFTHMFGKPGHNPAAESPAGGHTPSGATGAFSAPPIQPMFQPGNPVPGAPAGSDTHEQPPDKAGGEFTRFFQTVVLPKPDLPPPPPLEVPDANTAGAFTQLFRIDKGAVPKLWPSAYVTIVSCPDSLREGQSVPIDSVPFSVGRNAQGLSIAGDVGISRNHVSISWNGAGFTIRDLGSSNGTYVGGRLLRADEDNPLPVNAEIRLSPATRLRFRCDVSELPDFQGQKLADRYLLKTCLRASSKSALYEAEDTRPVREVVIKLLSPSLATYPGYLEQFEREAQTAASLTHPNICKIYEYGRAPLSFGPQQTKPTNYLVMQMLAGGDISGRFDAKEHTAPTVVAAWLGIVAGALEEAHRSGVVHAGLKPTSIVFSATGVPYVTDFAIATRPDEQQKAPPIFGAPEYLAPEQWDGLAASPASDQYSLAALCYRVLAGAVPFEEQLDPVKRARNFEEGALPVDVRAKRTGRPPIPPSISLVLARALSVKPADRYPTVTDFAAAFRAGLDLPIPVASKPKVFLSYRRDPDAGWAAYFADKLTARHGFDVFVDRQRVDNASQVPEKIGAAIRECDFFVCLLARRTMKSDWVKEEIRMAYAAGKPMIPVIQEGFKRPFFSWWVPDFLKQLMNAEEVRLFADYDDGAVEKLARMMRSRTPR